MGNLFHTFFTEPILNGIVLLYNILPGNDFGIAIVVLTIIIRTLLIPMAKKGITSQRALQKIQPEVKKIRKKYKEDPQKMTQKTMDLYKRENIHPMSGFLPLLVQIPVIFGLFRAIMTLFPRNGDTVDMGMLRDELYSFVAFPEVFESAGIFGSVPDLAGQSLVLAVLAGLGQLVQSRLTFKKQKGSDKKEEGMQNAMRVQMQYVFPVVTVFIAASLPAALALYWFTATVFAAAQHAVLLRNEPDEEASTTNKKKK